MRNYLNNAQLEILEQNPEYRQRGDKCPVCLGTGKYVYQEVEHDCPEDDYGHVMLRLAKLYWYSFIPLEYQLLLWDEYPHPDAKEEVEKYLANFERLRLTGMGYTIYGKQLGTGKTWTACHILRELVKQGYDGHFANFMLVKSYYELPDPVEKAILMRRIREAEILVLDEVKAPFSEAQRYFFEDKLEELLRERCARNFPTIVTSNLTSDSFEREYPRCYSLLSGKNGELELNGVDARAEGIVFQNNAVLALNGESRPIT